MKRYQCIKNVFTDENNTPAFKAGKPYPMEELTYQNEFTDEFGSPWIATDWLMGHFRFLESIDDVLPRDEADREPFTTPEPRRKLTAGWAWFIALVITIGFFIFKAYTE